MKLFRKKPLNRKIIHTIKASKQQSEKELGVNLVDSPIADQYYKQPTRESDRLRDLINEVEEGSVSLGNEKHDFFYKFWQDNLIYLQTQLQVMKILLLKIDENNQIEIERYSSFSFESLSEIELQVNKKNSLLKELILKGISLYFNGKITMTKAFKPLFNENEQNKYDQLYIFPLKVNNKFCGTLILVKETNNTPIPQVELKKLLKFTTSLKFV
ncbi:MAG: hypothetical protein OEV44_15180 [Spirochaetota bacterium]|nr:hypothetical protein [Spirochaetota bacterium]